MGSGAVRREAFTAVETRVGVALPHGGLPRGRRRPTRPPRVRSPLAGPPLFRRGAALLPRSSLRRGRRRPTQPPRVRPPPAGHPLFRRDAALPPRLSLWGWTNHRPMSRPAPLGAARVPKSVAKPGLQLAGVLPRLLAASRGSREPSYVVLRSLQLPRDQEHETRCLRWSSCRARQPSRRRRTPCHSLYSPWWSGRDHPSLLP